MNKKAILLKFFQFFVIVGLGVFADQWTKHTASERLATQRPGHFSHPVILEGQQGQTVRALLQGEFTSNSPKELEKTLRYYTQTSGGKRLAPEDTLTAGQKVHVVRREVTVIEGYWDHQYTRNPGAAFGILAESDSQWRKPFFVGISVIAFGVILYILWGVTLGQQLLIWGLALIASGAVGNFIDRLSYGFVIDFIVWKYTDAHRWPTFNVADALICAGVILMGIELVRDSWRSRGEGQEEVAEA